MFPPLLGEAGRVGKRPVGSHLGSGAECSALCQHLGKADGSHAVHCLPVSSHPPGCAGQAGPWVRRPNRFNVKSWREGHPDPGRGCRNAGGTGQRSPETHSHVEPQSTAFPNHLEPPCSCL